MFGRFVGLCIASLAVSASAVGQIVITLDTKPGTSLFGEHRFTALVKSQSLVTQVEFYVNGDLVATDESTPYEFVMDTLMYDEGEVTLTVSAYNRDGESTELDVKLMIDNSLDKGIEYHIERADDAVVNQKWDEAIQICRIALKIDDGAKRASEVAMAAILEFLGVLAPMETGAAATAMAAFLEAPVTNARGETVGVIRMAEGWEG